MPELNAVLNESRRQIHDSRKFTAALQGVDIDAQVTDDAFKRVQDNARRRIEEESGVKLADPALADFIHDGIDYESVVEASDG